MTKRTPASAQSRSEEKLSRRTTGRRGWLLLATVLTCWCGGGQKQIAALHDSLKPGMSVADVFGRIDELSLSGSGLSFVFADPEVTATDQKGGQGSGESCQPIAPHSALAWDHNHGSPWGRGPIPTREEVAKRFSTCDRIRLRFTVTVSRSSFVVNLKDGRVSSISALEGHLD
jgi:hypothetical protein